MSRLLEYAWLFLIWPHSRMRVAYILAGAVLVIVLYVGVRAMRVEGFNLEKACEACPSNTCVFPPANGLATECYQQMPPCKPGQYKDCCPEHRYCH